MSGPHVVTVLGARPQFVKASAVSRALAGRGVRETLVHTGQHFSPEMSAVFFEELEIPAPALDLGIASLSHGAMTGRMLEAIESALVELEPSVVLVYGDTNSTMAGALAATKLHVPVAHVEAGLRSFNRRMPEEINRVVTDHVADLLFAPTAAAVANLAAEGIEGAKVVRSGDVMYDTALHYAAIGEQRSTVLADVGVEPGSYVLATVHRAENTDDAERLAQVVDGLAAVARSSTVVLPLHPRTRAAVAELGLELPPGARVIDPVGYLDMVVLERHARAIVTDSGGVQKEAYFFSVPCVTLRTETEWVELVEAGWNQLCPGGPSEIEAAVADVLARPVPTSAPSLYGDGRASEQIAAVLEGVGPG